jgi:hypothetical protein
VNYKLYGIGRVLGEIKGVDLRVGEVWVDDQCLLSACMEISQRIPLNYTINMF